MGWILEAFAGLLLLGFGAFTLWVLFEVVYYQCLLGPRLRQDLGFRNGAAYLCVGGRTHSAVTLESVTPGGVFDAAGVRAGDVVVGLTYSDLFRHLHRHRRRVAELTVVDSGPGPAFHERPRRTVRFTVPPSPSTAAN